MLLTTARERRLVLVGGKGGVGKTSIASALALARARDGARVLLVSTDPAHNLGHLWGTPVGDEPTGLVEAPGRVDGVEIDPDATVREHLAAVEVTMLRLLPERMHAAAREHLARARSAPGTHESAVLDRLAHWTRIGLADYDLMVVDTAPTGHTLRLLALPEQLTGWTEGLLANRDRSERFASLVRGLDGQSAGADRDAELRRTLVARRERLARLHDAVTDRQATAFVPVLTAETLPVRETLALIRELDALAIARGPLVVNRRSPADAGALLEQRRSAEDAQLAVLRTELAAGGAPSASIEMPLLGVDGPEAVAALADLMLG